MRFNTGIAAMMEFVNGATKWENRPRAALEPFVLLLSPYAPHIAEELWQVRAQSDISGHVSCPSPIVHVSGVGPHMKFDGLACRTFLGLNNDPANNTNYTGRQRWHNAKPSGVT